MSVFWLKGFRWDETLFSLFGNIQILSSICFYFQILINRVQPDCRVVWTDSSSAKRFVFYPKDDLDAVNTLLFSFKIKFRSLSKHLGLCRSSINFIRTFCSLNFSITNFKYKNICLKTCWTSHEIQHCLHQMTQWGKIIILCEWNKFELYFKPLWPSSLHSGHQKPSRSSGATCWTSLNFRNILNQKSSELIQNKLFIFSK